MAGFTRLSVSFASEILPCFIKQIPKLHILLLSGAIDKARRDLKLLPLGPRRLRALPVECQALLNQEQLVPQKRNLLIQSPTSLQTTKTRKSATPESKPVKSVRDLIASMASSDLFCCFITIAMSFKALSTLSPALIAAQNKDRT